MHRKGIFIKVFDNALWGVKNLCGIIKMPRIIEESMLYVVHRELGIFS
jgi:hypothetical protein